MMPTELSAVLPARHIQEECGVFGVYAPETTDVAPWPITPCTPSSTGAKRAPASR